VTGLIALKSFSLFGYVARVVPSLTRMCEKIADPAYRRLPPQLGGLVLEQSPDQRSWPKYTKRLPSLSITINIIKINYSYGKILA